MSSFRQHYQTYIGSVVGRFRRQGFDLDDSLDLAQEVFLRLYKMWPRYEERGRFVPLLSTVAHGVRVDFLRAYRGPQESEVDELTGGDVTPERKVIDSERRSLMQRCLQRLSARQQQVVACKLRGEKGREIAATLCIQEGSIKTYFHRAQESLKDCIKDLDWQGVDDV